MIYSYPPPHNLNLRPPQHADGSLQSAHPLGRHDLADDPGVTCETHDTRVQI